MQTAAPRGQRLPDRHEKKKPKAAQEDKDRLRVSIFSKTFIFISYQQLSFQSNVAF